MPLEQLSQPSPPLPTTSHRDPSPQYQVQRSSPLDYDLVIVGGGIAGLTLACALRQSGLRIAVIEAQPPEVGAARRQAYAMSLLSGRIFEGIGVWADIRPHITRFDAVKLSDADYPRTVEFCPEDLGTEAVYYAAEHGVLLRALQDCLRQQETIDYLCPAELSAVHYRTDEVQLEVAIADTTRTLQTQLLVAADGARSPIRTRAGIKTSGWKYWQSCVTTTVRPEYPHRNIAYERFWPSGPFAILPLTDNRCQIVWTAPHAEAQALLDLDQAEFMAQLQQRYGDQMGRLTMLQEPRLFPVQLMQSDRYVLPRLALLGDAAHCCHPVGGQGLNMGIRDAAALAQVLQSAHQQGADLGDLAILGRYERWRRRENFVILGFTDFLDRMFSNRWLPLVVMRRLGLWVLSTVPPLKGLALRLMTGLFGRMPQLAKR